MLCVCAGASVVSAVSYSLQLIVTKEEEEGEKNVASGNRKTAVHDLGHIEMSAALTKR